MPSVVGSPTRRYTPPSSNDEAGGIASFNNAITSSPRTAKQSASSTSVFHLQDQYHQQSMSPPSSSSDDSPTTSADNNTFFQDDTEMLDYDYHLRTQGEESSHEALFFGVEGRPSSRFTSEQGSTGFSPFTAALADLKPSHSSSEFDADGDSPGIGSEMRGLRINSRFPSPGQGTVRLEDVMLPTENGMASMIPTASGSLFENNVNLQHGANGLFQSYSLFPLIISNFSPPYTLSLVGIPPQGAKSRVETQIKLDLQLLHPGTEDLVKGAYDYLKLPSYGVSKDKFRLPNLKGII